MQILPFFTQEENNNNSYKLFQKNISEIPISILDDLLNFCGLNQTHRVQALHTGLLPLCLIMSYLNPVP